MSEAGGRRRVRRARKLPPGAEGSSGGGVGSSVESLGDVPAYEGEEKGEGKDDGAAGGRSMPRVRISTEIGVGESKAMDNESESKTSVTPRTSSPKREKPPVTPTTDPKEDDRDAVDRSKGRVLPETVVNMLLNSWFLNSMATGYRLGPQSRGSNATDVNLGPGDDTRYLQACVTTLQMDTTNFVRPAVRVHVVYKDSGMYVKSPKVSPAPPATTLHSTVTDKTHVTWDEDLILKAYLKDLVSEDVLILFEILDDRPSLKATSGSAGGRKMKRLGWAFLLPTGQSGGVNVGLTEKRSKRSPRSPRGGGGAAAGGGDEEDEIVRKKKNVVLQVFENVEYDGLVGAAQRSVMGWSELKPAADKDEDAYSTDSIPSVYLQWRMRDYVPVPNSYMSVTTSPCDAVQKTPIGTAVLIKESPELLKSGAEEPKEKESSKSEQKLQQKAKSSAIKRLRGKNEPCVVPDRLLHRIVVGPEGAVAVKYSHAGNLLAVAAKTGLPPLHSLGSQLTGNVYSILLYDSDKGVELWREDCAHHGVIYDLEFSLDDSYMVSCSGDGTVKTWAIGDCHAPSPRALHTMSTSPPAYIYSVVFKEYANSATSALSTSNEFKINTMNPCPPVIAGGSDGRLRQWSNGKFEGYISVDEKDTYAHASAPIAHNRARVNTVTIDRRSRYLLSGDSTGEILVWRLDQNGWYQLLRRFKQEATPLTLKSMQYQENEIKRPTCSGINSLCMHPDSSRSQVLVMGQMPASLRLFSTTTYRAVSQCSGFGGNMASTSTLNKESVATLGTPFSRATLSPDGSYAIACARAEGASGVDPYFRLKTWDAQLGHSMPSPLGEIVMPFPAKDIAWHPNQHSLAVACQGPGAVLTVYVGERESAELAVSRLQADATADDLSSVAAAATALG